MLCFLRSYNRSTRTITNIWQPFAMMNRKSRSDSTAHTLCHPPFVLLCRLMLLLKIGSCGSKSSAFTHSLIRLISTIFFVSHDGTQLRGRGRVNFFWVLFKQGKGVLLGQVLERHPPHFSPSFHMDCSCSSQNSSIVSSIQITYTPSAPRSILRGSVSNFS